MRSQKDVFGSAYVLFLNGEHLIDYPEQSMKRRLDGIQPVDRAVAMKDLLKDLGVSHKTFAGSDRFLKGILGIDLVWVWCSHKVHRYV